MREPLGQSTSKAATRFRIGALCTHRPRISTASIRRSRRVVPAESSIVSPRIVRSTVRQPTHRSGGHCDTRSGTASVGPCREGPSRGGHETYSGSFHFSPRPANDREDESVEWLRDLLTGRLTVPTVEQLLWMSDLLDQAQVPFTDVRFVAFAILSALRAGDVAKASQQTVAGERGSLYVGGTLHRSSWAAVETPITLQATEMARAVVYPEYGLMSAGLAVGRALLLEQRLRARQRLLRRGPDEARVMGQEQRGAQFPECPQAPRR